MKRSASMLSALTLAFALALMLVPAAHADDESRAGPPYGPGWGMGPGMMGGGPGWGGHMGWGMGPGMMGGGPMMGYVLSQLPVEKREQLQGLHFAMHRQMIAKRAELEQAALTLAEAMHAYPVERQKALNAFQKLNDARREMFELGLSSMTQVQEIVGRELWEQMHSGAGFGPGAGYGPGMGPGMMGPGRGPGR